MPFMKGSAPIRRTTKYLEAGKIVLRETVKIFTIHYSPAAKNHQGAKEFVFWHLDQIQYKNPTVQCLTFKDLTPSPFIRVFLEQAENIIINVNCRQRNDILNHLINFTAICKSPEEMSRAQEPVKHDSLFGYGCNRHCICEVFGQVPCPRLVNLPNTWRRGRKYNNKIFNVPFYYTEKGLDEFEEEE